MGLLADGEQFLCDVFDATEAVPISYAIPPYDPNNTITLNGTSGTPITQLEPDAYTITSSDNRDWIVQWVDMVLGGNPILPAVGHRISETRGGVAYTYEVMDTPGDGAWRWHGAEYKAIRIHTTLVERV